MTCGVPMPMPASPVAIFYGMIRADLGTLATFYTGSQKALLLQRSRWSQVKSAGIGTAQEKG